MKLKKKFKNFVIKLMKDSGYDDDFSVALTCTSAIQGIIIPPSHNLVIYAVTAGGEPTEYVQETSLPNGDPRINLFLRKTANTPPEYPRHYGRIKKQPL